MSWKLEGLSKPKEPESNSSGSRQKNVCWYEPLAKEESTKHSLQ
jgi:hypothetical protein